jgi:hypothetical protein
MTGLTAFVVADREPQARTRRMTQSERGSANAHHDLDAAGGIARFGFDKSSGTTDFAGGVARFTFESQESQMRYGSGDGVTATIQERRE